MSETREFRDRLSTFLDRAEHIYLRVLRASVLLIASIMVVFALWLAISSAYKLSRSPDSVTEEVASVAPEELVVASSPDVAEVEPADAKQPTASPAQRQFYSEFVGRYYQLFRNRFEPYRQAEDKRLTRDEFDDSFVGSAKKLSEVASGTLDFESDQRDLKELLRVMTAAAENPAIKGRLQRYQAAKKVRVAKQVQRSRTEYRRGWDRYSTACSNWYYSPIGCAVQRTVEVPYTQTVYSMEFPKGTQSHTQTFQASQNRYFELLQDRRAANAAAAQSERENIMIGKIEGSAALWTALQIVAAFMVLMFFFLLIAIERHQRLISARLPALASDD